MADVNFNKTCKVCIYFTNPNEIMGTCRRFPSYQNRHASEYCGEFTQNPSYKAIDNIVQDITRESIMSEVGAIKAKPGRPRKND